MDGDGGRARCRGPQAQDKPRILRFEPNGPAGQGLAGNDRDKSKVHYYYDRRPTSACRPVCGSRRISAGACTRSTNTEFIYILEGSVTFEDKSGREETFKVGDAVLIPRGTEFSWKRTDNEKEYWAIFDRERRDAGAAGHADVLPAGQGRPGGQGTVRHGPNERARVLHRADGSSVGVWETQPYTAQIPHDEVRRADGVSEGQRDADHTGRPDGAVHGRGRCAGAEGVSSTSGAATRRESSGSSSTTTRPTCDRRPGGPGKSRSAQRCFVRAASRRPSALSRAASAVRPWRA